MRDIHGLYTESPRMNRHSNRIRLARGGFVMNTLDAVVQHDCAIQIPEWEDEYSI